MSLRLTAPIPPETKKSVSIVLIGNFLDFFDLMLATHLTVVLTKIFIGEESASKTILTAFTFCSAFCIRPIAALFWGYIGDTIGRVPVLIATTFLMSISCVLIPNIPSYAEWGVTSSILFLFMRLVQGFASGGECIAADVFITETVAKPKVYFCSALVEATCSLGGLVACGIGALCLVMSPENGWKVAFYIGSGVAVVGTIARKTLKETPEFVKSLEKWNHKKNNRKASDLYKVITYKNRNIPSLFAMYLFPAVGFYFSLAYIPTVLIDQFGLTSSRVMVQTTIILFITMCAEITYGLLGLKFHPFKIIRVKLITLLCLMPLVVLFVGNTKSVATLTMIQLLVIVLGQGLTPATPIINKSFPVFGRYTYLLIIWALSHSMIYIFTAVVCENISSFNGLCFLMFFAALVSLVGLYSFIPYYKMPEQIKEHNNQNFSHIDSDPLEVQKKEKYIKAWLKGLV